MEKYHAPVLLDETLAGLNVRSGGEYADLTFGEGGHTEAILRAGAASVLGVDRDPQALGIYRDGGALKDDPRLTLVHGRLSEFADVAQGKLFDGILADLGVSTRHLLVAERGFSLQQRGPLDMRMNGGGDRPLSEILDEIDERELADVLERNVDYKGGRSMARRILEARREGRLNDTLDLARVAGGAWSKTHPATPIFLALRMLVNEEYEEVALGIPALLNNLKPGGRLAVITFHSTEDRLVKRAFQTLAGRCICKQVVCVCPRQKKVELISAKPVTATDEELERNPRARSAKLRCVEKLAPQSYT